MQSSQFGASMRSQGSNPVRAVPFRPTPFRSPPLTSRFRTKSAPVDNKPPIGNPQPLPQKPADIIDQAFTSCSRAYEDGILRQRVELVLPLIGATDLDDWPGGIRQQFKAALPMVESLVKRLKQLPGLQGPLKARIIDDGDAVGEWVGENLALMLFPTAETLNDLRRLVDDLAHPNRLVLIVNPQWTTKGQLVPDFGIFPWQRQAATEVVSAFSDAYAVQNLRINGDYCTWLYTHPQGWQVNVVRGPGQSQCIIQAKERPTYGHVQDTLRSLPWTMSSKSLVERIAAEAEFNRRSTQAGPPKQ